MSRAVQGAERKPSGRTVGQSTFYTSVVPTADDPFCNQHDEKEEERPFISTPNLGQRDSLERAVSNMTLKDLPRCDDQCPVCRSRSHGVFPAAEVSNGFVKH